jgi:hypothetical protein
MSTIGTAGVTHMMQRRFPAPWSAEVQPNYYVVRDADGQQIAYVYYSNDPERRSAAKLLTKDEARRIDCDDGGSTKDKWAEHRVGPLGGIKIAML